MLGTMPWNLTQEDAYINGRIDASVDSAGKYAVWSHPDGRMVIRGSTSAELLDPGPAGLDWGVRAKAYLRGVASYLIGNGC